MNIAARNEVVKANDGHYLRYQGKIGITTRQTTNSADRSTPEPTFRIGAVSRLTGVSPDTLRVWERPYETVIPIRSETGTHLYSQDDVGRLVLIKALVDSGDEISCVANLGKADLEERVRGAMLPQVANGPDENCRVLVLGASLADRLGQEESVSDQVEIVGLYRAQEELLSKHPS